MNAQYLTIISSMTNVKIQTHYREITTDVTVRSPCGSTFAKERSDARKIRTQHKYSDDEEHTNKLKHCTDVESTTQRQVDLSQKTKRLSPQSIAVAFMFSPYTNK